MSLVKDFGLNSSVRKAILLALSLDDRKKNKLTDILHLQKIIRYFEYVAQKSDIEFSNFNLGSVSYEIEENVGTLQECGLIEKIDSHFQLTKDGMKAVKEIEGLVSSDEKKKLMFAKMQLNDLTSDELLFFMYYLIPSTQENSTETNRLNKKRKELSKSLFKKGRINLDTAIEWSGLTTEDFTKFLEG